MRKHSLGFIATFCSLLIAAALIPQKALADDDDPPSRVARLSYAYGSVSFQPAGTDDWVNAIVNRPITTGDKLWADSDSRAELHIGSASIRIAAGTGFSFLNLNDNVTQIQLTAGTIRVRVKRLEENESFEVDTPNLAFSVLRPGMYKINVNEGGDTTIIRVRSGDGEVTGGGSAFAIHSREMGTFNGTDQLTADIEDLDNENDPFDAWCADRDRHEDLAVSARYVSPDVIGYEDLDQNGSWRPVPEYGMVWFPQTTVVGWAPYRYGHWAYVAPWGYTWIDDAPWGFAPFHYGRWINYGGVWGWVPAPPPAPHVVYVRPVYAPALVAWVGGPHFAVGVGVGGGFAGGVSVGWFPLAPREVYVPSYPVSRTYVTNVNVSNTVVNTTVVNNYYNTTVVNRNTTVVNNNVTVIQQTYVNQRVSGAVTATTPQAFTSAQSVSRNVVHVDQREVVSAPVNAYTPSVPPAKQAVLGSGAVAEVKPPMVVQNRAVVAKLPPPPPPVSFARQRQAIQANGGRPLAVSQVRQLEPQNVQVKANVKVAPQATIQNPQGRGNFRSPGNNAGGSFNANGNVNAGGNGNSRGNVNPAGENPNARGNTNASGNAKASESGNSVSTPGAPFRGAGNASGQPPVNSNNAPGNNPGSPANANKGGGMPAGENTGSKNYNDRPPSSRPGLSNGAAENTNTNDARHQQQTDQLRVKQNQDQPKVEQQQQQDGRNLSQRNADDSKTQQLNQKQQSQVQTMEPKHDQQQAKFQDKQPQERKGQPPKVDKGNSDKGKDKGKDRGKDKGKDKDDHKHDK